MANAPGDHGCLMDGVRLHVFDVDRGFCAHAAAGKRASVLIDCGVKASNAFTPSSWLETHKGLPPLDGLVLSVPDARYTADAAGVLRQLGHARIYSNPSLGLAGTWESLLGNAAQSRFVTPEPGHWCPGLTIGSSAVTGGDPPLALTFFHNRYNPDFNDAGNLSLVTSLSAPTFHMLFGAALKADGWRALLQRPDFRDRLRTVDVLVASRGGERSGYCTELFEICEPRLIIVPDAASKTPADADRYTPHASGLHFSDGTHRCVLFTRVDGTITINEGDAGKTTITTEASQVFAFLAGRRADPQRPEIPALQRP